MRAGILRGFDKGNAFKAAHMRRVRSLSPAAPSPAGWMAPNGRNHDAAADDEPLSGTGLRDLFMNVEQAIAAADSVLPGQAAPEEEIDARWQAIIAVANFVEAEPEAVWRFALRWGASPDPDLRMAIATCVLEHILEYHFDRFITRVEEAALADRWFGDTVSHCWKFGQTKEPIRAARLDALVRMVGKRTG